MKNRSFCRTLLACLGLAGLLIASPAVCAAAAPMAPDRQQTALEQEIETLYGKLLDPSQGAPAFSDLGDGFYSLSMPLKPEARESLLAAARSGGRSVDKAAQTLFVISVGQAPIPPATPVATTHGAFSDTTFAYSYWVIVLNLGNQTVTRTTSARLTGPGLSFNKSVQATYGANGIWMVAYSPGRGVGTPGIYTFQGSVTGAGSMTNKSFAVRP